MQRRGSTIPEQIQDDAPANASFGTGPAAPPLLVVPFKELISSLFWNTDTFSLGLLKAQTGYVGGYCTAFGQARNYPEAKKQKIDRGSSPFQRIFGNSRVLVCREL
jgi:hypothetical protein